MLWLGIPNSDIDARTNVGGDGDTHLANLIGGNYTYSGVRSPSPPVSRSEHAMHGIQLARMIIGAVPGIYKTRVIFGKAVRTTIRVSPVEVFTSRTTLL